MRSIATVSALVLGAALALLSGAPYAGESADHALVRLSWRARGERLQRCRRPTDAELEKLPPHMRPQQICERGITPYRLRVAIDDSVAVQELVRAGGAENDRPLFVFAEVPVTPGTHRLAVVFERDELEYKNPGNQDEDSEHRETEDLRETPRRLTLDETVTLAPRAIVLVAYDDERRRLTLLAARDSGP
jgi:hypothetical protein